MSKVNNKITNLSERNSVELRPGLVKTNLSYNEEKYHVFYEPLASNLMPSIKVAERGGKMDK